MLLWPTEAWSGPSNDLARGIEDLSGQVLPYVEGEPLGCLENRHRQVSLEQTHQNAFHCSPYALEDRFVATACTVEHLHRSLPSGRQYIRLLSALDVNTILTCLEDLWVALTPFWRHQPASESSHFLVPNRDHLRDEFSASNSYRLSG